jgi:dCMP deaminase
VRPTLAETMLAAAEVFAARSTCSRLHVGAVLARDGRVLSTGYNGAPSGLPHCEHLDDEPCTVSVHAEANALLFAARHGVATEGAHMYCTHAPCLACAGLIVNAGLTVVAYRHTFRSRAGLDLLLAADILAIPYVP